MRPEASGRCEVAALVLLSTERSHLREAAGPVLSRDSESYKPQSDCAVEVRIERSSLWTETGSEEFSPAAMEYDPALRPQRLSFDVETLDVNGQ